jgi:drug/metabolite transporter (DMT)-like permease
VLFSTGGAAIKANELSGLAVAGLRAGIAALTLAVVVPSALRALSWRTAAVGLCYATTTVLYAASNKLTTAASSIFLQSTAPLYVLVLAPFVLAEPIRRRDVSWLTLTALGFVSIVFGTDPAAATAPNPALGNLMAAGAGFTWSITIMGLRWLERDPKEGATPGRAGSAAVLAGNTAGFLFCLPTVMAAPALTQGDWISVLYLGVFQIGLAYVFLTRAMARVGALDAVLLLLIEPVLAPIWAWWLHGEVPGWSTVLGGLLILSSTVGRTLRPDTIPR